MNKTRKSQSSNVVNQQFRKVTNHRNNCDRDGKVMLPQMVSGNTASGSFHQMIIIDGTKQTASSISRPSVVCILIKWIIDWNSNTGNISTEVCCLSPDTGGFLILHFLFFILNVFGVGGAFAEYTSVLWGVNVGHL